MLAVFLACPRGGLIQRGWDDWLQFVKPDEDYAMLWFYVVFSFAALAGSRFLRCCVTKRGEEGTRHGAVIFYNFILAFMHCSVGALDKYFYVYQRPDLIERHPQIFWFACAFAVLHFVAQFRNNNVNCFRWKRDMDILR